MDNTSPNSSPRRNSSLTSKETSPQEAERKRFVCELEAWKKNVQGEDIETVAEKVLDVYDKAITNPSEVVELSLSFVDITELPPLPPNLTALDIEHTTVTALPTNWPVGLTSLIITCCKGIQILSANLPAGLTHLNITCTPVTELPADLPDGLTELDISGSGVTELPANLPVGLTYLNISNTEVMELPDDLPDGLTHLYMSCTEVKKLPANLPDGLTELDISGSGVTELPANLPAGLIYLEITGTGVMVLPDHLPNKLTQLNISNTGVTELPEDLPDGLTHLDISNTGVTELPDCLPDGLTQLNISNTGVTELPANLPDGLTDLNISNTGVTELPEDLPAGLTQLEISDSALTILPRKLPAGLDKPLLLEQIQNNIDQITHAIATANANANANGVAYDYEEDEDSDYVISVEEWDEMVETSIQTSASSNQVLYNASGGFTGQFTLQEPTGKQIDQINSYINENLLALHEGVEINGAGIVCRLVDGADYLGADLFEPNTSTEWCLLSQGDNSTTYDFITVETATSMIEHGNTHPTTRMPLTAADFIRGEALLTVLNNANG